jgi:phage tail sheath protein FI
MPEYLAPGVYIEERPGQRTIEGVSTSTAAFVGITGRGPVQGPPILVTSYGEFQRQFGGYLTLQPDATLANGVHGHLPLTVKQFFDNGGKRAFISRVYRPNTTAPTTPGADVNLRMLQLGTGVVARLRSTAPAGVTHAFLTASRGFVPGTSTIVRDGNAGAPTVAITALHGGTYQADFAAALPEEYRSDTAFAVLAAPVAGMSSPKLVADEPGRWAESVRVQVRPAGKPPVNTTAALAAGATTIPVTSAANFYVGGTIQIQSVPAAGASAGHILDVHYATIAAIVGNVLTIAAPTVPLPAYATPAETWVSMAEVDILVSWGPLVERFSGSWRYVDRTAPPAGWSATDADDFNAAHSAWLALHQRSTLVRLDSLLSLPPASIFPTPYNPASPLDTHPTTADGQPTALGPEPPLARDTLDLVPGFPEYVGNPGAGPGTRSGLAALLDEESISLVAIPGITDPRIQAALIAHAEELKYRFAVLDAPPGATIAQVRAHRGQYDSEYAAIYYPWIQIARPDTGELTYVPPTGTVLGIYGRSDGERGVHKAPANEVTRNATDLETRVATGEQEVLNPEGINVIRDFRVQNRGIRVWGARDDFERPRVGLRERAAPFHLHRGLDRPRHAVGRVRAEQPGSLVPCETDDRDLPRRAVALGSALRREGRGCVLREVRSLDHDAGRHRERAAGRGDRDRAHTPRRVRDLPHRAVHCRCARQLKGLERWQPSERIHMASSTSASSSTTASWGRFPRSPASTRSRASSSTARVTSLRRCARFLVSKSTRRSCASAGSSAQTNSGSGANR